MSWYLILFFFNDTATTEIYTLSLHDALPISVPGLTTAHQNSGSPLPLPIRTSSGLDDTGLCGKIRMNSRPRSEEHTSELQSRQYLVCRLLLEKKKKPYTYTIISIAY